MRRRLLSLAMALAMALSLLPTAALATEEENAENNDNLAGMSKQDDTSDTEIPATTAPIPTDETMPEADGTPSAAASFEITEDTTELESGTYTLEKNVTVSGALTVPSGATVTIDLGGHTLTLRGSEQIEDVAYQTKTAYSSLNNNGSLTILNGTVDGSVTYESGEDTYYVNTIANKGNLTIGSDAIINGNAYAICNMGGTVLTSGAIESTFSDAIITYGGEVIVEGGSLTAEATNGGSCITVFNRAYNNSSDGAQVYINDGTLTAYGYVVSGNNLYSGGNNPPLSNVTITGGTLHSTKYSAIYWPISGTLTIGSSNAADTPTITSAGSAVEICSGTLMIHNGKLSSTASSSEPMNQTLVDGYRTHSGSAGPGDAVTIISRRGNGYVSAPLSVTIDGGTFSSTANHAIRYMDCNLATNAEQLSQDVTVNITGGTFESLVDAEFVQDTDQNFITGGTFSTYPGEYVPVGYTVTPGATEVGPYVVDANPDGGMEVTAPTTSGDSASATMDGVYTGTTTEVEGGNSTGTPGEETTGNRNGDVTVNLTTGKNTTSTTLTVTQSAAESLDAANSLTVVTDSGSVSLDNTALDKIAGSVTTVPVEITIQKTSISTKGVEASYRVSVQSGEKDLLPSGEANGTITITVPSPAGQTASAYQAWYVTGEADAMSYVEKLAIRDAEGGKIAIAIGHLSDIVLVKNDNAPAVVAEIVNGNQFTTLQGAINAAQEGQTVALLGNIVLDEPVVVSGDKTVTLDLSGCTVTPGDGYTKSALVLVEADGSLTIKDSKTGGAVGTAESYTARGISTKGTLRLEGGTVCADEIGILASPSAVLEVTGGTVAVTDAENSTGEAIKAQFESTVKLSGGTIQGGQSASGSTMGSAVSALGSSVEISGNAQLSGYSGVSLYNLRKLADGRGVLDNGAGAISSKLEMAGGSINTKLYAVTGNNLQSACSTATISGGTITTTVGAAIYWPMEGNLTITGTAKVTGPVAIEIKMGTLNISDSAELTGTAEYKDPDSSGTTGDGIAEADGSALRVSAEKYGNAGQYTQYINSPDLTVTVTGGTFTSTYGNAIAVYNTEAEANTSSLKVTGGTLTPAAGRAAVAYISEKTPTTATNSNVTSGEMTTTKTKTTVTVSQDAAKAAVTTAGTTSFYNTIDEAIKAASDTAQTAANGEIEVAVFGNGSISAANLALEDNIKLTVAANVELTIPVTSAESGMVVAASTDTNGNTVYQLVSAGSPGDIYVAQITSSDGTTAYYSDLPAAVKSVQNGQTIVLTKKVDAGTITVSRPVTFTIDPGNTGSTYTIQAGTGYVLYQTGNTYTISVYTPPVTPDNDTPSYSGGSSSEPSYSNTIDASDGGSVKVSPRTPSEGETVTITPDPDAGYEVDEVIVTDRNGDEVEVTANRNGTYTFKQPRGRVTIEVSFVRTDSGLPFIDVAENAWYYDAVEYVYENGMMNGTGSNVFSPNATTTRGMIVTMLYRLEGEPRVSGTSTFDDVADGMYYADAVIWANANGIVTGYDEATFGPNDAITREQMAAILYRYAQYKGYDTTQGGMAIREYADYEEISEYALIAMDWAVNAGLVTGTTSSTLTPDGSAVRAQVATIFMRFMEDVAG